MNSLVLELQQAATSEDVSITELLRKALLVASKLDIKEFEEWATKELNGYGPEDDLPEYRIIRGVPHVRTTTGTKPIIFEDEDLGKVMSKNYVRHQTAAEIEGLASRSEGKFAMSYPSAVVHLLTKKTGIDAYPILHCSPSSLAGIISGIREAIQRWSTKLEKDGILGEGMTFSQEEKELATRHTYHTSNYIRIGQMTNSQIQQGTEGSTQTVSISEEAAQDLKEFVTAVRQRLQETELPTDKRQEAESELATIETQLASPKPKRSIIKESLLSLKRISESVAGQLLASGLEEKIPALIALMSMS